MTTATPRPIDRTIPKHCLDGKRITLPHLSRSLLRGAFALVFGLSMPHGVRAATDYWTNNSTTNNLSNSVGKWSNNINPTSGDSWVFANTTGSTLTNNFAAGFNVAGITFNFGTAASTINGNSINLSGPLINNSIVTQTLNTAFVLQGSQTVTTTTNASSKFVLGGVISDGGLGYGLTFNGTNGTTTLTKAETYTGATVVSGSTLVLNSGGSLANSALTITNVGYTNLTYTNAGNVSATNVLIVSSTNGLAVGQYIAGNGIAANTYITAIGSGSITISANTTATNAPGTTASVYTSAGIVQAVGTSAGSLLLTNVTVAGNGSAYTDVTRAKGSSGTANFVASNSTINGTLTMQGPSSGMAFFNGNGQSGTVSTNPYGYAQLGNGVVATNVVVGGRLDILGNGSLSLSNVSGMTNSGQSYYAGNGSGVIFYSSSYTNSGGNTINFASNATFGAFIVSASTAQAVTFTSGGGTVTLGAFQAGGAGTYQSNNYTFSGGNWLLSQMGQGNSGQAAIGTNVLTNNANITVGTQNAGANGGTWVINGGSTMAFQTNAGPANGFVNQGQTFALDVEKNGTLNIAGKLSLFLTSKTNNGGTITNTLSFLSNNGGTVNVGGDVALGGATVSTNNTNTITLSDNHTTTFSNNLTLGGNTTTNTIAGEQNTVILDGGSLTVIGTLGAGTGTSENNSFQWKGGTLSVGTLNANSTNNWKGTTDITSSGLNNTNGNLLVGNSTNGYAGKTTINGNYTQSGSATTTFKVIGVNAPTNSSAWAGGATNYSQVAVSGTAFFGGSVSVIMTNGYDIAGSAAVLTNATFASSVASLTNATLAATATNGITGSFKNATNSSYNAYSWMNTNGYGAYEQISSATNLTFFYATNSFVSGNWGTGGAGSWAAGIDPNSTKLVAYFGTGSATNVTLDANRTVGGLIFSNTSGYTINGNGSSTLTLDGSAFGGTNTIKLQSGNATINNSVAINSALVVTNAGATTLTLGDAVSGNGGIQIASGVLAVQNATVGNSIDGAGSLLKNGAGTVSLSGNNSYTGGTTISAGTLLINGTTAGAIAVNGGALGGTGTAGDVTLNSGGSVNVSGGSSAGTLMVSSLIINGGSSYNWNLFGSSNDLVNSTGAVTFNNTSSSKFTINIATNGITSWDSTASTNFTILTGGSYSGFTNSSAFAVTGVSANGTWAVSNSVANGLILVYTANGTTITVDANAGASMLQSGLTNAFAGNTTPLYKTGAGEYVLDTNNTYAGGTTIAAGTLTAANNSSFGSSASINLGTSSNGGSNTAVNINTAGVTVAANISSVGAGTNLIANTSGGTVTYAGAVSLNTNATFASTGNLLVNGSVSGNGTATVAGAGTVTFAAANTYSGGTVLNSGTLALSNNAALGSGTLSVSGDSTLQVATSLANTNATVVFTGATETLDAKGNNFTNSGNISGQGGILTSDSTGTGTLTLSGSNNYAGTSTVNRGTLELGSANALPSATTLVVSGTGVLNMAGYNESVAALSGGGVSSGSVTNTAGAATLTVNGSSSTDFAGTIGGALGLTKSGAGTLTLGGSNTFNGATLVNGGGLVLNGSLNGTSITVTNATFTEGSTGSINGTNIQLIFNAGSVAYLGGSNNMIFTNSITTPLITVNSNAVVSFTGSGALAGVATNTGTRFNVLTVNGGQVFFTNSGTTNAIGLGAANQNIVINGNGNGVTNLVISNGATLSIATPSGNSGAPLSLTGGGSILVGNQGTLSIGAGNTFNIYGPGTNTVVIGSGGTINVSNAILIGQSSSGYNQVTNAGTINGSVTVGGGATGGTNILNNAAVVSSTNLYIGTSGSSFNSFTNSGTTTVSNQLYFNTAGSTNKLDTTGTLTVSTSGGFRMNLGNNTANFLSGSTSIINGMNIGGGNSTNLLTVYGNATLTTTAGVSLGYTGGQSNTLVVNSGGVWNATGGITVGQSGAGGKTNLLSNNGTITATGLSLNTQSGIGDVSKVIQSGGTMSVTSVQIGGGNGGLTNSYALLNVTGGVFSNSGAMTFQGNTTTNGTNVNNTDVFQVDGGTAYAGTGMTLGYTQSLSGSNVVNLNGGTLVLNGTLSATAGTLQTNSFNWNGGTLSIATVTATGAAWNGPGSIFNNTLYNTNVGTLIVGNLTNGYAGKTLITGNYSQGNSATSTFNVFGTNQASSWTGGTTNYSFLTNTGTATLAGNIVANFGSFTPATNNTFTLVSAAGGLSSTATLRGANAYNGYAFWNDGLNYSKISTNATTLSLVYGGLNQWQGGTGTWDATTNSWTAGVNPNATNLVAYFGTNGAGGTVTVTGNKTNSALILSNNATGYTLNGPGSLSLGASGAANLTSYGSNAVNPDIALNGRLNVGGTGTLTLGGNISGNYGLNATNSGTLVLAGSNSYTGTSVVNGGTVVASTTNSLTGWQTLGNIFVTNGGTLAVTLGDANWSGNSAGSLLQNITFDTNTASKFGLTSTAGNYVMTNNFAGNFGLSIDGVGTVTLQGDNSGISSGITLVGGGLAVSGSSSANALGGGSSTLTLNGVGTQMLNLGGTTQSLLNLVNANANGGTLVLTNGTISITDSSKIMYLSSLNQASNASITGGRALRLDQFNNGGAGNSAGVSTLAGDNSGVGTLTVNGGTLYLDNNKALGSKFWVAGNETLASRINYTNDSASLLRLSSAGTVSVLSSLDFGGAKVDAGGVLQLASNTVLTLTNGIISGTLTAAGSGTVIVGGASTSDGTTLNSGTLVSLNDGALGQSLTISGGVLDLSGNINTFGTVNFTGSTFRITNGSLNATNSYTVSNANVTIDLGGVVDLMATAGTNYLTGNNTYTGLTIVTNGATLWSAYNGFTRGFVATNAGSTFVASGSGSGAWNPSQISSSITLDSGAVLAIDATGTNYQMTSSLTNGTNFTLGTFGTGTVTLADPAANYSGVSQIAVSSGTLNLGAASTQSSFTLTNISLSGGTLDLGAGSLNSIPSITISGGLLTNGAINTANVTIASNAVATIGASITGFTNNLTIGNGAVITITSTGNDFGPRTVVGTNATLNIAASQALPSSNTLVAAVGSTINFTTPGTVNSFTNAPAYTYTTNATNGTVTTNTIVSGINITNSTINIANGATVNYGSSFNMNYVTLNSNSLLRVGNGGVFNDSFATAGTTLVLNSGSTLQIDAGGTALFSMYTWNIGGSGGGTNLVTNAGTLVTAGAYLGNGATNLNQLVNTGVWTNTSGDFYIGRVSKTTATNMVVNQSGGTVVFTGGSIKMGAYTNAVGLLSNAGTMNMVTGNIQLGAGAVSNQLNQFVNTGTLIMTNTSGNTLQFGSSGGAVGGTNLVVNSGIMSLAQLQMGLYGTNVANILSNSGTMTMAANQLKLGYGNANLNRLDLTGTLISTNQTANIGNTGSGSTNIINVMSGGLAQFSTLNVGNAGSNVNQLNILNGGAVTQRSQLYLGYASTGGTNLVSVASGGVYSNSSVIQYGGSGVNNSANTFTNAGSVTAGSITMGFGTSSSNTNLYAQGSGTTVIGGGTVGAASVGSVTVTNPLGGTTNFSSASAASSFVSTNTDGTGWAVASTNYNSGSNNVNTIQVASGAFTNSGVLAIGAGGTNNLNTVQVSGGSVALGTVQLGASSNAYASGGTNQVIINETTVKVKSIGGAAAAGTVGDANQVQLNGATITADSGASATFMDSTIALGLTGSDTIDDAGQKITVASAVSGSGALTKAGSGTLTLSGSNSYQGGTTINAGTLQVGNGGSTGTLGSGDVKDNTSLVFSRSDVFTVSNSISGSGTLTQSGSGTLILNGANSYLGGTYVQGGTLSFGTVSSLGSGNVSLSSGAAFSYSGTSNASLGYRGVTLTTGSATIGNTGGGLLNIMRNVNNQGTLLTFSGGSFRLGLLEGSGSYALSNATVTLNGSGIAAPTSVFAGSTLNLGGSENSWVSPALVMGASSDLSSQVNTLNLNGYQQRFSSLVNLGGGMNQIIDSVGDGFLSIAGNCNFGGSIGGTGTSASQRQFNLVIDGASVKLTGDNTYTGNTSVIYGSSLDLGGGGRLSGTKNVVLYGSTLLLGGGATVNSVNPDAALSMMGSVLSAGGEGATNRIASQSFSSLTLTANSVISFANLRGTSSMSFGSITLNGNSLSIYNWNGTNLWGTTSTTGGENQFTHLLTSTGLSQSDLNSISFYSGEGTGFLGNGFYNGSEIVPVPEPGAVIAACMLLGWLLAANRGFIATLIRRRVTGS